MLVLWPLALHFGCWGSECFEASPDGLGALLYPTANLVCLYALGLYRRDTMIDTRNALARVPLAVSLGAVATACCLAVLAPWIGSPADRVRLFAGAFISFSTAGILARLIFLGPQTWRRVQTPFARHRRRHPSLGPGLHAAERRQQHL